VVGFYFRFLREAVNKSIAIASDALLTFNHSFTADHLEMQHMKKTVIRPQNAAWV